MHLSSSSSTPGCCSHNKQQRRAASQPRSVVAAAAAVPRSQQQLSIAPCVQQLQQQQLQKQPQQQPALAAWPKQLRQQPQVQQQLGSSRCSVVAAAGRRRRQDVGAVPEEEDPDLDLDDVMYAGDDEEDGDVEGADDTAAEDFDDFEEDEEVEEEDEFVEFDEGEDEEAAPGDEDWAAALDEFDTSLDASAAAADEAPSKEEQELAAARAMVGYKEDAAELDGTSLVVSEVPPEEPDRPKTFEEQTEALTPQDKQTLEQNMASYTVFPMFEVDLLVSSTPDGQLVLSDCFCLDTVEDSFLRPVIGDHIPSEPSLYQIIPWEHTKTGDLLRHKDPEVSRMKLYFIGLHNASPHDVDMSRVYSFDARNMLMEAHTPQVLGAVRQEDMLEPVMRIREDGVWIEDSADLPGNFFIAEGFAGHPLDRYQNPDKEFDMHEFVKMGLWDKPRSQEELLALQAGGSGTALSTTAAASTSTAVAAAADDGDVLSSQQESQLEERLEELELLEELDDMPDIPAVDMSDF